jgi:hypothetical protein
MGRYGAFLIASCVALGVSSSALAEYPALTPPGQHFTIPFPPNAPESVTTANGNALHRWTVSDASFAYLAIHAFDANQTSTGATPAGELADFIKGSNATILDQETTSWPAPDGRATAVLFHFRMPNGLVGRGVYVIDYPNGYTALIIDRHPGSDSPYMSQFVNSLTILP